MAEIGQFLTSAKENITFNLRVKKFSTIYRTGHPKTLSVRFEVGEGIIGSPTKWRLKLGSSDKHLLMKIHQLEPLGGVKLEKCVAEIKAKDNPDKSFVSIKLTPLTTPPEWEVLKSLAEIKSGASLVRGELVIHLTMEFSVDQWAKVSTSRTVMEQSRNELSNDLRSLLDSGINSDFEIQVVNSDGKVTKMKVHKSILKARSAVFEKMLETLMTETATGLMVIEDLSPECVNLMLKWIYSGILDEKWKEIPVAMVLAADKYDLACLRSFLDKYLHEACNFKNAMSLRKVARSVGLKIATNNLNTFITTNISRILEFID